MDTRDVRLPSLHAESPQGETDTTLSGAQATLPLSEVLAQHGLPLNTRCGGRGLCDGCAVSLLDGGVISLDDGRHHHGRENDSVVLQACRHRWDQICPSLRVRIPEKSFLAQRPQVVTSFVLGVPRAHAPLLPEAAPHDAIGAAVDLGTTTVVVTLVDMADGRILATASGFNQQMRYGEDVLTRIRLCGENPDMIGVLREAIVAKTLVPLLQQAFEETGLDPARLQVMTVAGNTTMLHLFVGEDPSPMGLVPFRPVFLEYRQESWTRAVHGFDIPAVHLLPGCSAYVGADLTAGLLSTGQYYRPGVSLLVDIGTNGEMILKNGDRLIGCATAAGPAFEGAGLTSGMRGVKGAIAHLKLSETPFHLETEVIEDGTRPAGVCGSGYIDFLAEARRVGWLGFSGRFVADLASRLDTPSRLHTDDSGKILSLARTAGSRTPGISEVDIALLLQAKAAIAAGIATLLEHENLPPESLEKVYLAGGFGLHLNVPNAIACGLLPGMRPEQVEVVGNTSLGGAYLALLDRGALGEMIRAAAKVKVIELNEQPGFEDHYIDALGLPES